MYDIHEIITPKLVFRISQSKCFRVLKITWFSAFFWKVLTTAGILNQYRIGGTLICFNQTVWDRPGVDKE